MSEKRKVPEEDLARISGGAERLSEPPDHSPSVPAGKPTNVQIGENKEGD